MSLPSASPRRRPTASDLVHALSPSFKAYAFGLVSVTLPRIVALLLAAIRGRSTLPHALRRAVDALRRQLPASRFPFTCGLLVFGATALPRLVGDVIGPGQRRALQAFVTFACSFAAALASFRLLNQDRAREQLNISDEKSRSSRRHVDSVDSVDSAGRTLDLTLFGLVRAVDVCLALLWARSRSRFSSKVAETIEHTAVPTMFATSSALVMWTWFYTPELLPPSYRTWISSAAQIDERLPQALRELRQGTFIYGKDTGREALLGDMSSELGMPREWGDPAKTVPIPCELYHSGTGKNCEYHALSRFWRGWRFAMAMYLPLNLGVLLLRRTATLQSVRQALKEASRSSAFLGAFVALFYYGVCLGRTRIGPRLMDEGTPTCQYLESGPNVATGCALCGWSILLEKAARRTEIAFFVAPRALATVLPRRYPRKDIWREQLAYALSAATLLTAGTHSPRRVRGVFGRVLQTALA